MIKTLEVENFGVLKGLYNFSENNTLIGINKSGKSSIGKAIAWAFTGRDASGSQSTAKYRSMMAQEGESMLARLTMDDGATIERRQTQTGTKSVKVNGNPMSQEEFEKVMPVEWDVFLSAFMVGFFEKLQESSKRELFMKITPTISKEEIFRKMTGSASNGVSIDWSTPTKKLYEQWNKEKLNVSKEIDRLDGALSQAKSSYDEFPSLELVSEDETESLNERLNQMLFQIKEARDAERAWSRWNVEASSYAERLAGFEKAEEKNKSNSEKAIEIERRKRTYHPETETVESISKYDESIRKYSARNTELPQALTVKHKELAVLKSKDNEIQDKCEKCNRVLSASTLKKLKDEYDVNKVAIVKLSKDIHNIEDEIHFVDKREKDEREAVEFLRLSESRRAGEVQRFNQDLDAELSQYKVFIKVDKPRELSPEPVRPNVDIALLENEQRMISQKAGELSHKKLMYEANLKRRREEEGKISRLAEVISKQKESLVKCQGICSALHPKTGIDAKVLEIKMEKVKLEGIEFVLVDTLKNGEEVECFKVKSVDGIEYDSFSDGQKIKASMRISLLIDELTGKQVDMMFVDNVDLIDQFSWPKTSQAWICKVSNSEELQVVSI